MGGEDFWGEKKVDAFSNISESEKKMHFWIDKWEINTEGKKWYILISW